MSAPAELTLVDQPASSRFDFLLDGTRIGQTDYRLDPGVMTVPHTEIDPRYGGRGFGTEMVRQVLDEIRGRDLLVRPSCPFVAVFIRRHPEYADLLA